MHIAIDVREACKERPTGKGMWVRGCVSEFLTNYKHSYTLLTDGQSIPEEWKRSEHVSVLTLPKGVMWHISAAKYLLGKRPDMYISATSFIVPRLLGKRVPYSLVIHDLIAFRKEPHNKKASFIERLLLKTVAKNARSIFCISKSTKKDLCATFPHLMERDIHIIYAGCTFRNPEKNVPDGKTIFYVSTLCPRKNQLALIKAYAELPDSIQQKYKLVLAGGRGWHDAEIIELARTTPGVRWIGYTSDENYKKYLKTCAIFAYPSLYEGFGIPVLDAFQHGAAVFTSNKSSTAEIAEGAAVLTDPTNIQTMAKDLLKLLLDSNLQRKIREAGLQRAKQYSWEKTANLLLETIEKPLQS